MKRLLPPDSSSGAASSISTEAPLFLRRQRRAKRGIAAADYDDIRVQLRHSHPTYAHWPQLDLLLPAYGERVC